MNLDREHLVLLIRVLWAIAKVLLRKADIEVENPEDENPDIFRILPL